jgi:hypothetical protein
MDRILIPFKVISEAKVLNAVARSWEGEPHAEPWRNPARTEPRPPGIMQSRLVAVASENSDVGDQVFPAISLAKAQ